MYDRYYNGERVLNNLQTYEQLLRRKKIRSLIQYGTFSFNLLSEFKDMNMDAIVHFVQPGEKLFTISQRYYNSPDLGWLICYTNNIPSELNIKVNQPLNIYFPVEELLRLLNGNR